MKKLLIISALLMAAFQIQASSYFTMGVRDTVYINPASSGLICEIPVKAHFESRYDSWTMTMTFPDGLAGDPVQNIPSFVAARDTCMDITYVTSDGTSDIYEAVLTDNDTTYTCSSTITEYGYWDPDNDGIYETYGTTSMTCQYYCLFCLEPFLQTNFKRMRPTTIATVLLTSTTLLPLMPDYWADNK